MSSVGLGQSAMVWRVYWNELKNKAEIRLENAMSYSGMRCPNCSTPLLDVTPAKPVFIVLPEGFGLKDIETTKSGVLVAAKPGLKPRVYSESLRQWCPIP